ncbi:MAG: alpha/beta fold hydrolase [Flavobacteriales bacterium]|nr:alpha/beta fold hydrolase [Flavobacteriales bacterium]
MRFTHWIIASLLIGLFACQKEAKLETEMNETIYLRSDKHDMPAFVRGNGASKVFILVLHGGPGGNGLEYSFGNYAESLESRYAMVYWDQRHQGNSHGSLKDEDVTLDKMVDDTYNLIRLLKERYGSDISVFLFGHSWGGTLGTAFMVKDDYQSEVKGWIEASGAHDIPMLNVELVKMIKEIAPVEIAKGNNTSDWQEILDYANSLDINNITFDQSGQLNQYAHRAEGYIQELKSGSDGSTGLVKYFITNPSNAAVSGLNGAQLPQSFMEDVENASFTDELHKITTPTLLQWGKYDFVVPPALGYSAYDKIGTSNKTLKIYEFSGHSPMNNEDEQFVADIVDFVEQYK